MKVLLVQPALSENHLLYRESLVIRMSRAFFNRVSRVKFGSGSAIPPFALMHLAALTPPDHEVTIVDECVEQIAFDQDADLVGITLLTPTATRGYEIADRFRARGVAVVLGGMHPTVRPEEATQHADAVVVGEAEQIWGKVLADARSGALKPYYAGDRLRDLRGLPVPRRDLFEAKPYLTTNLVQTTRGCPNRCSFCSVHAMAGKIYRRRPIREVIAEIKSLSSPLVLFIDDNIAGSPAYARELFQALAPLGVSWCSQSSLSIADDDELLGLAALSGCKFLLIGFESLSPESIESIGKSRVNRTSGYETAVRRIHDHGIGIAGTFILGLDGDDAGVFERTTEFIRKNRIEAPTVGLLTPYPGTRLHEQLAEQGRITDTDWRNYSHTMGKVVFQPARMTSDELAAGHRAVNREILSATAIAGRFLKARGKKVPVASWNIQRRKVFY